MPRIRLTTLGCVALHWWCHVRVDLAGDVGAAVVEEAAILTCAHDAVLLIQCRPSRRVWYGTSVPVVRSWRAPSPSNLPA